MIQKPHLDLLVRYLKPQWQRAALMACLLLASILFQAWGPQVLRQFIDLVTRQGAAEELVRAALVFLGVVLAGQAVTALAVYASAVVAWEATNRLRADLALHCLRLDMRFHHAHLPGEMIQRVDGDVGVLGNFFSQFTVQMAANSVLVLAILALVFRESPLAGGVLVVYVVAALGFLRRMQKAAATSFDRLRAMQGRAVGFWEEMLTAREDVKPLGALGYVLHRNTWHEQAMFLEGRRSVVLFRAFGMALAAVFVVGNAVRRERVLQESLFQDVLMASLLQNVSYLSTGLLLLLSWRDMLAGSFTISDFALFTYFLPVISDFVMTFGGAFAAYKQSEAAFERLSEPLEPAQAPNLARNGPAHLTGPIPPIPLPEPPGPGDRLECLEVENLTCLYPGSGRGIRGVSLRLEGGSFTAITGRVFNLFSLLDNSGCARYNT